ncbi:hypothetical protein CLOP_g23888, partial [Closterium sp. NIES-67]
MYFLTFEGDFRG